MSPLKPQNRGRGDRWAIWTLLAVSIAAATLVVWRTGALEPLITRWYRVTPSAETIVFVVLDTVRADHLSLCGYDRPTSPTLESLARDATWTCDAYAPGSWTLPSHASYFTGLDVPEHGTRFHAQGEDLRGMTIRPLGASFPTLAERLGDRGYQTLGVVGNPVLVEASGLARGFDYWAATSRFGFWYGEDLVGQVRSALRTAARSSEPLFLFVNIADAHDPWPRVDDGFDWIAARQDRIHYFTSEDPGIWESYVNGEMSDGESAAFRERITDLYDFALYRADRTLGRVIDELEAHGWTSAGLRLVVTSDHGEFLGEHQLARHGRYLWEPNQRVPVLAAGTNVASLPSPMSALDVYHLVLDGRLPESPSLATATAFPDPFWMQRSNGLVGGSTMAALWTPSGKLVWQDDEYFGFDLSHDPSEDAPQPLPRDIPAFKTLASLVDRLEHAQQQQSEVDEELLERLRSLGYLR